MVKMKRQAFALSCFFILLSLTSRAAEDQAYRIRIETRNLGYTFNSVLNANETKKYAALVRVLKENRETDLFALQEAGPDLRVPLVRDLGPRFDVLMWPEAADVAILLDRQWAHGLRPIEGTAKAWISKVGFSLSWSDGSERYAWLSHDFDSRIGRIRVISIHGVCNGKYDGVRERAAMFGAAAEQIKNGVEAGMAVVMAGDLNMQFDLESRAADQVALQNLFEMATARSRPAAFTYQNFWVRRVFDYILGFASPLVSVRMDETPYSRENTQVQTIPHTDHLMLRTEFALERRTDR